jgi:hypothetical protein
LNRNGMAVSQRVIPATTAIVVAGRLDDDFAG